MSLVERTLRTDPGGAHAAMDFASRDRYRHVIEEVAKASGLAEEAVAGQAIELARSGATRHGGDARAAHVGYYLVDRGRAELESATRVRLSPFVALQRVAGRSPLLLYLGTITLITVLLATGLLAEARADGAADWALAPLGVLALLATSQLAVALVNWLATLLAPPHPLPRMDFSAGIPPASRALVVVPTMLTSRRNVDNLVEALEVRFLANRDANLHLGLVTDFADAAEETLSKDAPLLAFVRERIEGGLGESHPSRSLPRGGKHVQDQYQRDQCDRARCRCQGNSLDFHLTLLTWALDELGEERYSVVWCVR